jgi:hypothetical protein
VQFFSNSLDAVHDVRNGLLGLVVGLRHNRTEYFLEAETSARWRTLVFAGRAVLSRKSARSAALAMEPDEKIYAAPSRPESHMDLEHACD